MSRVHRRHRPDGRRLVPTGASPHRSPHGARVCNLVRGLVAVVASVCLPAQRGGPDVTDARIDGVRTELRAWYAASLRGPRPDAGEWHRLRLLRLWPARAEGEAWLRDMKRLRDVFARCFQYEPLAEDAFADLPGIEVHVPAAYDPLVPMPVTFELRGRPGGHAPAAGRRPRIHVRTTPALLQALMQPPRRPTTVEVVLAILQRLTAPSRLSRSLLAEWRRRHGGQDDDLVQRGLFLVIGAVQRRVHVDRDGMCLDGEGTACAAVLRAATAAPDRFAAVVLRDPDDVPAVAYENLAGIPVLIARRGPGDEVIERLRQALSVREGQYEVRRTSDEQVVDWCSRQRRHLMRSHVALVMRQDDVVDGYWVAGISADLTSPGAEEPARIDVVADKVQARITVRTRRIERFSLLLNDDLIDLDREFVLEVNDVAVTLRRSRSLSFLGQIVGERFDPSFLFTTALAIDVPRRG